MKHWQNSGPAQAFSKTRFFLWIRLSVGLALLAACSSDDPVAVGDVGAEDVAATDVSTEEDLAVEAGGDVRDEETRSSQGGSRVIVDLAPYRTSSGTGARVFQAQTDSDLLSGEAAEGRIGDYVLENDLVRVVIEGDDRVISPCPYGGNPIDVGLNRGDGAFTEDVMGELCLLFQLGQTVDPDQFEVIADGTEGGTAILAVTGHMELLDFFNLFGMIDSLVPGLIRELSVDAEVIAPYTVTTYYLLDPASRSLSMVTAIRNDGEEAFTTPFMRIAEAGGEVEFFNPLSAFGGFGFSDLGGDSLTGEPMPFLAFASSQTSYAYVPDPDPELDAPIPIGGSYLMIAGMSLVLLGNDNVLETLISPPQTLARRRGIITLAPGETVVRHGTLIVGDGSLSSVIDLAYSTNGTPTGMVEGVVRTEAGGIVSGALVSASAPEGAAFNRVRSDPSGQFSLSVPAGIVELAAHTEGGRPSERPQVDVTEGETENADPTVIEGGALLVQVRTPGGDPLPARVTVMCEGPCPDGLTAQDRDVYHDRLPSDMATAFFSGSDGAAQATLPAGDYRVFVSRGMEYSTWPPDAISSRGQSVSIEPGSEVSLNAEIARVIDSSDALAAEFHVHTLHSMDTSIPVGARVSGLVGEGIEVLVATDHDVITDFGPQLRAQHLDGWAVTVMGEEISTDTYGHFNGFPLERDPEHRHGGALDWAGGPALSVPPVDVFAWIESHPGEQVVQVNHADNLGMIRGLDANVLYGTTRADPAVFRLPSDWVDEETGDTGLWSDAFTAFEILNGQSDDGTNMRMRWWLAMVGRGFSPTGTAVTDSHTRFGFLGAVPRSYVFGSELGDFSPDRFAEAINDGRVVGTNGPFIEVTVANAAGHVAGSGEVLATGGEAVEVIVHVQTPSWIDVDTVQLFSNIEDVAFEARNASNAPLTPTSSHAIGWEEGDTVEVVTGETTHTRRDKVVRISTGFDEDAYLVVMVLNASGTSNMYPIVRRGDPPLAFANPVFIDADGGGYDHPPYLAE